MNCEQLEEHMADYLAGSLEAARAGEFEAHLAECAACRNQAAELRQVWAGLGLIPAAQPSRALRTGFYQSLDAYRQGIAAAHPAPHTGWWARPAWAFGLAAAMLVVGVGVGHLLTTGSRSRVEIAQLQNELHDMRRMVTLAMLERQSPSDRLRGVDLSERLDNPDTRVLAALLDAVNRDPNVNVRLAAVDALGRFGSSGTVRNALGSSLERQDSPMVQVALIDLLVSLRERAAAPAIRNLMDKPAVNPSVKQRAAWGLSQLEQ